MSRWVPFGWIALFLTSCLFALWIMAQDAASAATEDWENQAEVIAKIKAQEDPRDSLEILHGFLSTLTGHGGIPSEEQKSREINLQQVVQILVKIGDPTSLKPLQDALNREESELSRVFLAWGTATLGDTRGTKLLLQQLKDTGAPNRYNTAKVLREPVALACKDLLERNMMQPDDLIEVARQASAAYDSAGTWLKDLDVSTLSDSQIEAAFRRAQKTELETNACREIWTTAFAVLAASKNGVPTLTAALQDSTLHDLRGAVAYALGTTESESAVTPLIEALRNSQDDQFRKIAGEALKSITGEDYGEEADSWTAWWESKRAKK